MDVANPYPDPYPNPNPTNPNPNSNPNPHRVEVVDVAAAALASDAPSEEPAVVVKVVDTAAARSAVVRPCLAHAHVAVRRQAGALELARAAHAVGAQLQVFEPLDWRRPRELWRRSAALD